MDRKPYAALIIILLSFMAHAAVYGQSHYRGDIKDSLDSLSELIDRQPDNVGALRRLGMHGLHMVNDSLADECGTRLIEISRRKHDDEAATYGNLLRGQAALMRHSTRRIQIPV